MVFVYSLFTSVGEYEIYMMESSAFVFYGMESFLTQLPPYKVASLNFEGQLRSIMFGELITIFVFRLSDGDDL